MNYEIVFEAPLELIKKENRTEYTAIMLYNNEKIKDNTKDVILPSGKYLTMYYDDRNENSFKYYKKMIDYIEVNNIQTIGCFNEFSILARINSNEVEKSIVQLEIQIR